ncbi:MAG: peptidoglycan-binding protein, partial [Beijerinckiaceae bacterium]
LPENKRKQIQDGLVWTGDYKGAIDGDFGPMTFRALRAFSVRNKGNGSGILTGRENAALDNAAGRRRAVYGFRTISEPRSGVKIGLPMAMLPQRLNRPAGAVFRSKDRTISVETVRIPQSNQTLADLYEQLRTPAPGRRIGYSVLRDDFLVVSSETRNGGTYARFASGEAGGTQLLRGFILNFPKSRGREFDILTIAISNGFEPFDKPKDAKAEKSESAALQKPAKPQPPPVVEFAAGTAINLAPDLYLAVLPSGACKGLRIGKAPATVTSRDKDTGLAILRAPVGGGRSASLSFDGAPPASGEAGYALFAEQPFAEGEPRAAFARGEFRMSGETIRLYIAAPVSALGGIYVLADGKLAGLLGPGNLEGQKLAGALPPASRSLIAGAKVAAFLAASGIKPAASVSAPAVNSGIAQTATHFASSLAPLWCTR